MTRICQASATSVLIEWTPPNPLGDTTGYRVNYYTSTGGPLTSSPVLNTTTTSYTLTNVVDGRLYYISVEGVSEHYYSGQEQAVSYLFQLRDAYQCGETKGNGAPGEAGGDGTRGADERSSFLSPSTFAIPSPPTLLTLYPFLTPPSPPSLHPSNPPQSFPPLTATFLPLSPYPPSTFPSLSRLPSLPSTFPLPSPPSSPSGEEGKDSSCGEGARKESSTTSSNVNMVVLTGVVGLVVGGIAGCLANGSLVLCIYWTRAHKQ